MKLLLRYAYWGVMSLMLLGLCTVNTQAQGFNNLYHAGRPSMLFGSVYYRNNSFYLTGVTSRLTSPYYSKSFLTRISAESIYDTTIVYGDTNSYSNENFRNSLHFTVDGNYLFIGSVYDSVSKAYLAKVDTNGNLLLYKEYAVPPSDFLKGQDMIDLGGEGYLLLLHVNFTPPNSDMVIIRTDTNGNVISQITHSLGVNDISWCMQPMMNGNFMVGSSNLKSMNSTPYWCRTWLVEIDSFGNKVREWIDSSSYNMWPKAMKQTADSGWIITRQHLAYDNQYQDFNASVLRLDKDYNIVWDKRFGDSSSLTALNDIEILADGNIIASGITPTWGDTRGIIWGWIIKIDRDGTIIWDRKYTSSNAYETFNYLYDIDVLPNGDMIACGEKSGSSPLPLQQAWLLRTDSNGCELENCLVGIEDIEPKAGISIYPNPTGGVVNINIEHINLKGAALTVTNPIGQVLQKIDGLDLSSYLTLNLGSYAEGLYFISVQWEDGSITKQIVKE